jgi:hypothetical protein
MGAGWFMYLFGVGIEHVGDLSKGLILFVVGRKVLRVLSSVVLVNLGKGLSAGYVHTGIIVDNNAGLDVVSEDAELNSAAVILNRIGLHKNALGNVVETAINGSYAVHYVIFGILNVVCHLVLKGKHTLNVHISCSCD